MQAGLLKKRITIQVKAVGSPAQDEYGEPNTTWQTFKTVWASIEPIQGREFWAQQQVQSEITHRVRVRYVSGVTADMRILYGARVLSIKHIIDAKENHNELQLMCVEGVRDG